MADNFRTMVDWEDIRFFVALARHGSLSATARALTVNHATVARRVVGLEKHLGVKLIERRPNGYELTAAGRSALEVAGTMEAAAEGLPRLGVVEPVTGLIRISATPSLAESFLISHLAVLQIKHPALNVELVADRRSVSLSRHEADLALRLARPEDGELIARHLVSVGFGFYANKDWQARVANGEEPDFVGFDEMNTNLPEAIWLGRHFPRHPLKFRANSQVAQASAARAGCGIALLPHFLGRTDVGLRRVFLTEVPPARELWLLTRHNTAVTLSVRLTRDFLIELFQREHEVFDAD